MNDPAAVVDCLIVGGGPAGLTAALYLKRFRRSVLLVDGGESRAAWIPESHNIPFFSSGISGKQILAREREHAARYDVVAETARVTAIAKSDGGFVATIESPDGAVRDVSARRVVLATGAVDVEPDLPDVPDAVRRGLVRYCPICDGYEAIGKRVAVIARGDHGVGEAIFIRRTYSDDVTLLTLGEELDLQPDQAEDLREKGVTIVEDPIVALDHKGDAIGALRTAQQELRFDILYSALGLRYRSELGLALGARHDERNALWVDEHCQTSVKGLYAIGDVVIGLDQIVVGMGQAAYAATHIHNRCEYPTDDE
ncbi:NAD(P)/FAD-dependent oxidoreductase [Aurantimonas sp. HBX-1]|uniref:NAD(P)/FAD-dependent oxidoreductase n=1 Tax=Aurantimonas sp. HBX-1 TaxID=2906072 RepID=UPI001F3E8240|nr:NAD(P)/FAD-dependent oxidoreductase [Aurantimonas sp. HBX-1]UIJ73941.1 NAD(P)/FAD-dependent oxidoreductase [Aurantimonas sp. HBX-1]